LIEDDEDENDIFNSGEYVYSDRKKDDYYSRSWNECDEDYDW
jgi:hypothetical protein